LALLVCAAALLGTAQAARAGTVSRVGNTYFYDTGPGDTAGQFVDFSNCVGHCPLTDNPPIDNFLIHDNSNPAPTAAAGSGCEVWDDPNNHGYLLCPNAGITHWVFTLRGGNDTLDTHEDFGAMVSTTVSAGAGDDVIDTGSANGDVINGGTGEDVMDGGEGTGDLVDYSDRDASADVTVLFDDVANDGAPGASQDNSLDNVKGMEGAIGGEGDDRLGASTTPFALYLDGRGGDDTLDGGSQDDQLLGGAGGDLIRGNDGFDTVHYDDDAHNDDPAHQGVTVRVHGGDTSGSDLDDHRDNVDDTDERVIGTDFNDLLIGNSDVNDLQGGPGDDTFQGRVGQDLLTGGPGRDTLDFSYFTSAQPLIANLTQLVAGTAGDQDVLGDLFENVTGGAASDTLTGSSGVNTIRGGGGNDTINPGGGADTVNGDAGDDNIETRDGAVDTVNCGAGTDTNNADSADRRTACELPAPPSPPPPPPPAPVIIVTPPPPPSGPNLRTPAVTVAYKLFDDPKKTTRFVRLTIKSVPRGSTVVGRCVTKRGKRCKGRLGKRFTRSNASGSFRLKSFEKKNYPAGSRLEFIVTNPAFFTQIKTITTHRNGDPSIGTRCQDSPTSPRRAC
jgi:Ca2+-binding RTX toxin-like protein